MDQTIKLVKFPPVGKNHLAQLFPVDPAAAHQDLGAKKPDQFMPGRGLRPINFVSQLVGINNVSAAPPQQPGNRILARADRSGQAYYFYLFTYHFFYIIACGSS